MKTLLTTTMILGAVLMLEASQPVNAAVTAPVTSSTEQSQVTPVWHYFWHTGPGGGFHPGFGGGEHFHYHYFWHHR